MNEMLNRPLGTDHWGQTTVFGCFSQLTVAMSGNRGLSPILPDFARFPSGGPVQQGLSADMNFCPLQPRPRRRINAIR